MKNLTFKNREFTLVPFTNAAGKERFKLKEGEELLFTFAKSDLEDEEDFIDDVVFNFLDKANRNSIFNTKDSCIEFGNLIVSTLL